MAHQKARVTERGWGGHFICSYRCLFRRNTLIEGNGDPVIVSTVGGMERVGGGLETIGYERYYETMCFGATQQGEYLDADVSDERSFDSDWAMCYASVDDILDGADNQANDMHEAVVKEFVLKLSDSQV